MSRPSGEIGPGDDRTLYELEAPPPAPPDLGGGVVVAIDADEVLDLLASDLVAHAENCVRQFGDFHLALSAGRPLEPLYKRLMYDPDYRRLPWRRTHLWLVAEHCVPLDDERSSYRMIREIVGDHADIPREQFHPIPVESETAVEEYDAEVREALGWREKGHDRLDYALLSMDSSGAAAGLAPGATVVPGTFPDGRIRILCRHGSPDDVRPASVSMTPAFLNGARFIAVLATGADRAGAVRRLGAASVSAAEMPIKSLAPLNGELKWYLDAAACGADEGGDA